MDSYFAQYLKMGLFLLLISQSAFSQFALEDMGPDGITLHFETPTYTISDISVDGETICQIVAQNASFLIEKGEPEIPYYTQNIQIPSDANMAIKVMDITYDEVKVSKILPSKGNLLRRQIDDDISYVYNKTYLENSFYKDSIAYINEPFIFRDVRGVTISMFPFQYNPISGILRVVKTAKIVVYPDGESKTNLQKRNQKPLTAQFDNIYKRVFINYEPQRYNAVLDGEKMVVITHPNFTQIVQPLVDWKNQKGIKTSLYEYGNGSVGSSLTSMKSFIQKMYDDSNTTYFLLVGDFEKIPSPMKTYATIGGSETVPADPSMMKLNGTDNYADAFLGRLSVQTESDAKIVVEKLLAYEKNPDSSGVWYKKAVGIASSEGKPTDISWVQDMRKALLAYNYVSVDSIYQGKSPSVTKFTDFINDGRGWVNFMGHGNVTGFGFSSGFWYKSSHVNNLINGSMLPVIISVACSNGQFNGKNCFAEKWLKHPNGGAIAFLGSSPLQDWKPPQDGQKEMVRLLSLDEYISLGAIIYNGEAKMVEVKGDKADKTFNTWTLFGDPSMMVYTDKPQILNVKVPTSIGKTDSEIHVDFGESIDGRVALYNKENGLLSTQMIKGDSTAVLPIPTTDVSEIIITVTGRNKVPFSKVINIEGVINVLGGGNEKTLVPEIDLISSKKLNIKVPENDVYHISMYLLSGKMIYSRQFDIKNGLASLDLHKLALQPNVYIVNVTSPQHNIQRKIILK